MSTGPGDPAASTAAGEAHRGRRPAAILAIGVAIALALAAVGLRQNTAPPSGLEGKQAPVFSLPLLTAKPTRKPTVVQVPSSGKPTLLHFWGPSCAPCVAESPAIAKLYAEGKASGAFDVITVSAEDVPDIRAFIREKGHDYPVLYDADGRGHGHYHVNAIPVDFIIDGAGVVRHERRGASSEDELRDLLKQVAK